ncbi:serine/threonine-protein phosphatase [Janthinobacterium sp.]|uniref:PP2C family protein-serine/threonine phosphatase n=1 Tax=Janthinobacterium sp. TaxID=1871054 RepID=UPI00293D35F9|nr:serine/threonine-protein phosphatase [Janthinobacterium sp.]
MSGYKIEAGTGQHIAGRPQQNDRCALYAGARAPGHVLAVLAEGTQGGAGAAEQVLHTCKQLFDTFSADADSGAERVAALLREIIAEAHAIIKMTPPGAGGGARAALALLVLTPRGQAVWAQVGAPRLYRFSGAACALRSDDGAYLRQLLAEGVPEQAARAHRQSAPLNNALGNDCREPFVTSGQYDGLRAGDAFLLASDGLWPYFSDAELAAVVARETPRAGAERLINKALERAAGKGDNCTLAILKLLARPA